MRTVVLWWCEPSPRRRLGILSWRVRRRRRRRRQCHRSRTDVRVLGIVKKARENSGWPFFPSLKPLFFGLKYAKQHHQPPPPCVRPSLNVSSCFRTLSALSRTSGQSVDVFASTIRCDFNLLLLFFDKSIGERKQFVLEEGSSSTRAALAGAQTRRRRCRPSPTASLGRREAQGRTTYASEPRGPPHLAPL